jgi:hypothetical protein
MKLDLSKLHNHFVKENPITKMMFDEFPNDFMVFGGSLTDFLIGNPNTVDYDAIMLNNKWKDAEDFLLNSKPNRNRWQLKKIPLVQGTTHWDTFDKKSGKPKRTTLGHGTHFVSFEEVNSYNMRINPILNKWYKPCLSLSKLNRTDPMEMVDVADAVNNRIGITKNEVLMRDERPLECIKWRTLEYDGWCTNPGNALGRCNRYKNTKGFYFDEKLENSFKALIQYRIDSQDVIKDDNIEIYTGDEMLPIAKETDDIYFNYENPVLNKGKDLPKRYKIDYHYNDSGMIKEI